MKAAHIVTLAAALAGTTALQPAVAVAQEPNVAAAVAPRPPAKPAKASDKQEMAELLRLARLQQLEIESLKKRLQALEGQSRAVAAPDGLAPQDRKAKVTSVAARAALGAMGGSSLVQAPRPPVDLPDEDVTPPPPPARGQPPALGPAPVTPPSLPPTPPAPLPESTPGDQAAPNQPPESTPEGERPKAERPTEQLLVQQNAILLPSGTIQVEPAIDYNYFSNSSVAISGFTIFDAIVIGTINVNRVTRDMITASVTGRYGLFDRVQLDARVPAVYRRDTTLLSVGTNNAQEKAITGKYLGDVEAGVSYQPIIGSGAIPNVVLRGRFIAPTGKSPFQIPTQTLPNSTQKLLTEAPTGNGFFGTGLQATAVWRSDPVVLFTGLGYTYNFAREFDTFGRIQPGGYLSAVSGANIALNDTVSLNFSLQAQHTFESKANGTRILGSSATDARFVAGASIGILPRANLIVSAIAGLTPESPSYGVTVSLPFTF